MALRREAEGTPPGGRALLGAVAAVWIGIAAAVLLHRQFVTNDSLSNYAHVWFISGSLRDGIVPYHFPALGHGDAVAFPYGFIPWTTAALARPLLGDWATTLWLVLGTGAIIAGTFTAFPELRKPLPAALVLANPLLVETLILGQLPFAWAAAMLLFAVALWRREHRLLAALAAGAAQATHPSILLPLTGLLAAWWFFFGERDRRSLALWYAASLALALPGVAMVFLSPVIEDSGLGVALANLVFTATLRAFVLLVPLLAIWLSRRLPARAMAAVVAAMIALNVALVPVRDTAFAWGALNRDADHSFETFLASDAFHPGSTYRLLRVADGKVGMYQLIRAGGKLDSEFFPESIDRRSWPDAATYVAFLDHRKVDFVVIYDAYTQRYQTNEHDLLESLTEGGCAQRLPRGTLGFDVYQISRNCRSS